MELNQIKQFRLTTGTESISEAAKLLFIAQPSLCQTEIGTPLFDRKGRKIVLDEAGKIFLKNCDEIVVSLDSALMEINEYIGNEKIDINIRVESSSLIIPEIAEKMRKNYPWSVPLIINDKKYITKSIKCCFDALEKYYTEYAEKFN